MIKINSVMNRDLALVNENCNLAQASLLVSRRSVNIIIVTRKNKPVGIVRQSRIIEEVMVLRRNAQKTKVKDIMDKDFILVQPDQLYSSIELKIRENPQAVYIATKKTHPVGIITERDLITATRDFNRLHLLMQDIILILFGTVTLAVFFLLSPLGQSLI